MSKSSPTIPLKKKREHPSLPSEVLRAPFTPDGTTNITRVLETIRYVVGRLLSEGYTLKDGRLLPPAPSVALDAISKATEKK